MFDSHIVAMFQLYNPHSEEHGKLTGSFGKISGRKIQFQNRTRRYVKAKTMTINIIYVMVFTHKVHSLVFIEEQTNTDSLSISFTFQL